jgi:hypothetical protein
LTGAHRIGLTAAALGVMPFTLQGGAPVLLAPAGTSSVALAGTSRRGARWNRILAFACTAMLAGIAFLVWLDENSPFYLLAAAIAITGWLTRVSAGPATRWALFCSGATLATHAVFFGEDRYHIVIVPMFCVLAARAFAGHAEGTSSAPHL